MGRMRRTGRIIRVAAIAAVLAAVAAAAWPRIATELAVRKFLRDPSAPLTPGETARVLRHMLTGAPSEGRQDALVAAAVEGLARRDQPMFFMAAANAHARSGAFGTLPGAVGRAVREGRANAGMMVDVLAGAAGAGRVDQYIDVDTVMRSSDAKLILTCVIRLRMPALLARRGACLAMLARDDVPTSCKRVLVTRIAHEGAGAEWFADREGLLASLPMDADADAAESVRRIRRQIAAATRPHADR